MAYIELIPEPDANGRLAEIYRAAVERAGRVYQILKVQSQNPSALEGMLNLYVATMKGVSPLSRAQREMLAVVTSRANHCHY